MAIDNLHYGNVEGQVHDAASARISAALEDIAIARSSTTPTRATSGGYADGYFSALCFALGVLIDEPPARVADRALRRVGAAH